MTNDSAMQPVTQVKAPARKRPAPAKTIDGINVPQSPFALYALIDGVLYVVAWGF